MAASQEQKVDFLLKKIGYTASKTGIAEDETGISGTKKAPFAEPIPSPLTLPGANVWAQSNQIPTTPPVATTPIVRVYKTGSAQQLTFDSTVADNRSFVARETVGEVTSTVVGDWVDTQFGADYIVKVYKGDPNSGGVQLSAAGSGSNDTWFFDYSAGVLNFNGTNVPSGITTTNIFIEGYRYTGIKGVTGVAQTFTNLEISGITTFNGAVDMNSTLDVDGDTQLDDLNVSGVSTFSSLVDVNNRIDVVGGANIDQVNVSGVSTFNDTLHLPDDKSITLGNDDDLELHHIGGSNSYIKNNTGQFEIRSETININSKNNATTFIKANASGIMVTTGIVTATELNVSTGGLDVDGQTDLDEVVVAGVATFTSGIDANGTLDVDGHTELDDVNVSGAITATTFTGNLTGNADTAGKADGLTTARTIGGVSFDGSSNINLPGVNQAGNQNTSGTAAGLSGSPNITITDVSGVGGNFTGVVTASSGFSGNLTGTLQTAAQPNITSLGTLSAVTVSGNINANGNIVGDSATNITGIAGVTASTLTGTLQTAAQPNVTSLGTLSSLNVTGDVSIGGTLTYEDVTNIDSVGIITARTGINVLAGGINAVGVVTATSFDGSLATTDLTGTITNAQLAGSIANDKLSNSTVSYGGISLALGASDATPAFDLSDATNYPTSSLSGTITNAQLAGSIANDKLANSSVNFGGVSLSLGGSDTTPAFNLSDATNYPFTSLTGITTSIVGDTTPKLGGDLNGNSKNIFDVGISSASAFADFDYLQAPFGSTVNFTVVVDSKDSTHRYNGSGSGSAYIINGVQSPFLTLSPGRTYRFNLSSSDMSSHPFRFYYDANRSTSYTTNVTSTATYTEITITDTTPIVLHYQCASHALMGNAVQTNSNVIDSPYAATLRDTLTVTNNITANGNIAGDGSTNITGIDGVTASTLSGTVQTAAQPNITSLGTLSSATVSGDINANGNIVGDNSTNISGISSVTASSFFGNGSGLIGVGTQGPNVQAESLTVSGISTFNDHIEVGRIKFGVGTGTKVMESEGTSLVASVTGSGNIRFTANNSGGEAGNIELRGRNSVNTLIVHGTGGVTAAGIITATGINLVQGSGKYAGATGILTAVNVNSIGGNFTGVVTATSFSGTLVTAAQPNITSLGTLSSATVSGNINANGNIVGDSSTNITGIAGVTASTLTGTLQTAAQPNITSVGTLSSLNVTGNVSVGGTLTYEDVTNIDSVGLVTARNGVRITAGGLDVTGVSTFSGNITGTGDLTLTSTDTGSSAAPIINLFRNSASPADADYLGQIKFQGESDTGVQRNYAKITGKILDASNGTEDGIIEFAHIKAGSQTITGRFRSDSLQLLNDTALSVAGDITANGNINGDGSTNITGVNEITAAGNITANGNIVGDNSTNISGINSVTASTFFGNGANLSGVGTQGSRVDAESLTVSGISTFNDDVRITAGGLNVTGVVTATSFSGDGSALTGIAAGFDPDADENLVAGTCSGCNLDGTDGCFNLILGTCAGRNTTSGDSNVFLGKYAGCKNTTGDDNIFMGRNAGRGDSSCSITGSDNVAIGMCAGTGLTSANRSVFIGILAGGIRKSGSDGITGCCNIGIGYGAGMCLTTGCDNIFMGLNAGASNCITANRVVAIGGCAFRTLCTGSYGVAIGFQAGSCLCTGSNNIFIGKKSGCKVTSGQRNVFVGNQTKYSGNESSGTDNVFVGDSAGAKSDGSSNVFIGRQAACQRTDGNSNVAIGACALKGISGSATGGCNVALGNKAGCCVSTGFFNTLLGACAGLGLTTGSCNVVVGHGASVPSITGDTQLSIGVGHTNWISGTCDFNVTLAGIATVYSATGIVSATKFCGDGSALTGIAAGFSADAQKNLFSGETCTGCSATSSAEDNIALGDCAGKSLTSGIKNILIGQHAGQCIAGTNYNVVLGSLAGCQLGKFGNTAEGNTFLGFGVGRNTGGGAAAKANTLIGCYAGKCVTAGCCNTFLGVLAGSYAGNITGNNNVAIGRNVCLPSLTGSDQLAIGSGSTNWITGNSDFNVGIRTTNPSSRLSVDGDACVSGVITATSFSGDGSALTGVGTQTNLGSFDNLVVAGITTFKDDVNIDAGGLNVTGVVTATSFSGDGSNLTGVGFTPDDQENLYAGTNAGASSDSDTCFNIGIGFSALASRNGGRNNVAIGRSAGESSTDGSHNVYLGGFAGCSSTSGNRNIFMGYYSGSTSTTGSGNVFLGRYIGYGGALNNSAQSVVIGDLAGCKLSFAAHYNVFLGAYAGRSGTSACRNTLLGYKSASNITEGDFNVVIGSCIDLPIVDGNCQLLIGNESCRWVQGDSSYNVTLAGIATVFSATGIVSATKFCGDGSALTGISAGFSQDDQGNLVAGDGAGAAKDSDTCFNIMLGCNSGAALNSGDNNILLGCNSGCSLTSGGCNVFLGQYAGKSAVGARRNVVIGCNSGRNITSGDENIIIGSNVGSGHSTGSHNIAIGNGAGNGNPEGHSYQVAIGQGAGKNMTESSVAIGRIAGSYNTGNFNTFIGAKTAAGCTSINAPQQFGNTQAIVGACAGYCIGTSQGNSLLGFEAGKCITSGSGNVFVGKYAGRSFCSGGTNIGIGFAAGCNGTTGGCNIAFGFQTQLPITTGSDQFVIGRQSTYWITGNCDFNVGIGTTNPSSRLSVAGDACVSGVITATSFSGSGANLTGVGTQGINVQAQSLTVAGVSTFSGAVSVNASGFPFTVQAGNSTIPAIRVNNQSGTQRGQILANDHLNIEAFGNDIIFDSNHGGGTAGDILLKSDSTTIVEVPGNRAGVIVTGDVSISGVATATDFDSTSDIRLKTNIKPIDDPVSKVIQIEGVSFNWKKDNRPALGVIADQVEEILPQLVHGDDPKTVNYNGLVGLLIEVVKDQQKQIEELSDRISKLE